MHLKVILSKALKTIIGDLRRAIIGIVLGAIVLAYGGVYLFAKSLFDASILILSTPLPLWAAIALSLLLGVYIHVRSYKSRLPTDISFHPEFGVFWDDRFDMHCRSCGTPLKNSSHGPSVFYCADPQCNSKHILKDDTGKELTRQEALDILKSANGLQPTGVPAAEP